MPEREYQERIKKPTSAPLRLSTKAVKQLDRVCAMLKERGGRFVTAKQLAAEYL